MIAEESWEISEGKLWWLVIRAFMLFCFFFNLFILINENSPCLIADRAEKVKFQIACFNFTGFKWIQIKNALQVRMVFEFGSIYGGFWC